MKIEQLDIFGNFSTPLKKEVAWIKRNWEDRFQRWCNRELNDGTTANGKCGYGSMCDYCDADFFGRPCVRALNQMLKEKGISIDYENAEFCDIWNGELVK